MSQIAKTLFAVPLVLGLTVSAQGCGFQVERLFPDRVADGAARLSMANLATLVGEVSANTDCGFKAPDVLAAEVTEGNVGERGAIVTTVTGCVIDFGEEHTYRSTNCRDVETHIKGRVTVDAVKTVRGRITGDPSSPVIPDTSESATISFNVKYEDYEVRRSVSERGITFKSGSIAYDVQPHLAQSASTGACSISGSNLGIENATFTDIVAEVDSGDSVFEAEFPSGVLNAQIGKFGTKENWLSGTLTAWDTEVQVPINSEFQGLDPDFDGDAFREGYECTEDLLLPISYSCPDITPLLGQGASQLTIATFANIMRLADADETCGFSSPAVLNNPELLGTLGEAGGQARYTIETPCAIDLPEDTIVSVDCNDKISFADGQVFVSGTKVLSGIRTGDPLQPVVPTDNAPAIITLEAELENFRSFDSSSGNVLEVLSGTIGGTARPRTAIDTATGACSIVTPVVTFENISFVNTDAVLTSQNKSFRVAIAEATLQAQNGKLGDRENELSGTITIDGQTFNVPTDGGEPNLDPSYDPEAFLSGYACTENMVIPESDADCGFMNVLGEGAARLLVAGAGAVASKINADDNCGFEAYLTLLSPYLVEGDVGQMGLMSWNIEDCSVGSEGIEQHDQSCTGGRTMTGGFAHVDATRYVAGERTDMLIGLVDAIVPRERDAVTIELTNVTLEEFTVEPWGPGAAAPKGTLTIHSGTLSATVKPILGEREEEDVEACTFDVPTSVAVLENITLQDADATLVSDGKTFRLTLDDVVLNATNGSWNGVSNTISGSLKVNGQTVTLEPQLLDDTFTQTGFDEGYACTANLLEVIDPEVPMSQTCVELLESLPSGT